MVRWLSLSLSLSLSADAFSYWPPLTSPHHICSRYSATFQYFDISHFTSQQPPTLSLLISSHLFSRPLLALSYNRGQAPPSKPNPNNPWWCLVVAGSEKSLTPMFVCGIMIVRLRVQEDYIITRSKQSQFSRIDNNSLVYFYIFIFIFHLTFNKNQHCHIRSILLMSLPLPLSLIFCSIYVLACITIQYTATNLASL